MTHWWWARVWSMEDLQFSQKFVFLFNVIEMAQFLHSLVCCCWNACGFPVLWDYQAMESMQNVPYGIISSFKAYLKLLYHCIHKNVMHFNTVVLQQRWESMVSRCWSGSKLELLWHFPSPGLSRDLRWKIQAHRCILLCSLLINLLKLFFCSAVGQPL